MRNLSQTSKNKYDSTRRSVNNKHRTISKETTPSTTNCTKRSTKMPRMNIQVEEPCIITEFDKGTDSNDVLKLPPMTTRVQK